MIHSKAPKSTFSFATREEADVKYDEFKHATMVYVTDRKEYLVFYRASNYKGYTLIKFK